MGKLNYRTDEINKKLKQIDEIIEKLNLHVSNETVRTKVIKLGYTYKKKSLHASERERSRCKGTKKKMD